MRFLSRLWFYLSFILVFPFLYKLYVVHVEMRDWVRAVEDKTEENESYIDGLDDKIGGLDSDLDASVSRDDFDEGMRELGDRIEDCATEDDLDNLRSEVLG